MSGKLFQHGTINALMAGQFDGSLLIKEGLSHGSMGIGTLDQLDGELVILNGKAYQVKVDGSVHELKGEEKTPYLAVTHFEAEKGIVVDEERTNREVEETLKKSFSSLNTFQAIKVTGTFIHMQCRSVAKQKKPYQRLVEAARNQAEFTKESVKGTLIGFFTPDAFGTIAVPGIHWHFLSEKKDFGGHVLEFLLLNGKMEWQTISTLEQHFPVDNPSFMESKIDDSTLSEDIEEAE